MALPFSWEVENAASLMKKGKKRCLALDSVDEKETRKRLRRPVAGFRPLRREGRKKKGEREAIAQGICQRKKKKKEDPRSATHGAGRRRGRKERSSIMTIVDRARTKNKPRKLAHRLFMAEHLRRGGNKREMGTGLVPLWPRVRREGKRTRKIRNEGKKGAIPVQYLFRGGEKKKGARRRVLGCRPPEESEKKKETEKDLHSYYFPAGKKKRENKTFILHQRGVRPHDEGERGRREGGPPIISVKGREKTRPLL